MAAMESSAPVLQLHGEKQGTESGVEKLENGGKSAAAAAAAWEGGMKDLRDVYPGKVLSQAWRSWRMEANLRRRRRRGKGA